MYVQRGQNVSGLEIPDAAQSGTGTVEAKAVAKAVAKARPPAGEGNYGDLEAVWDTRVAGRS